MIIDEVATKWDARRTESRVIPAAQDAVYRAVLDCDFVDAVRFNRMAKAAFAMRARIERIASALRGRARVSPPEPAALRLTDLPQHGWVKLGENPGLEFAFGAVGRFWGGETVWQKIDASEFAGFRTPGHAKIACNLLVQPRADGNTRVTYDVRTIATDPQSRRAFLRYWRVVSPMVGLIMRATLSVIARNVAAEGERDILLDRFMPEYEAFERHSIRIAAPADVVFAAASEMHLGQSRIVRAIFRAREVILGGSPGGISPSVLVAQTKALGWGVLAEVPAREVVMGAITQPWATNVVFRALAPTQFADHLEPGYVKIAWTLRADRLSDATSVFRTETRVAACDSVARSKFPLVLEDLFTR